MLRQLPANKDMDLFLGAAKVPYTFRDRDRYPVDPRGSPVRVSARYQVFPPRRRAVRREKLIVWKYRAASGLHFVENGR